MLKLKKMVTVAALILLGVFLMVSFSGANPSAQTRPVVPIRIDSNAPIPSAFLESALKDSIDKRNRLIKENDSLVVVRKHKSEKIMRLIHNMVHRKREKVIVDTIYVPKSFVPNNSINTNFNYLLYLN